METNIQEEWKQFTVKLLYGVSEIQKVTENEINRERKIGKTYIERLVLKNKLKKIQEYKIRILKPKSFELSDEDMEYIIKHGYKQYFRIYEHI